MYHILFNLGEWLDGRVWPRKDQLEVLRLMDLIHHVTGASLPLPLPLQQSGAPARVCSHRLGQTTRSRQGSRTRDRAGRYPACR